jgi:CelD/BcsL family acetyltransferase involved in cellulose biosynthesis
MIQIRCLQSLEDLDAAAESYDRLIAALGPSGLYYEREWIRAVWPVWGAGGAKPALLLAERDGESVGLLPLQSETKGWTKARLRRLCFLGYVEGSLLNGVPDYLIPNPDHRDACVRAFHAFLLSPQAPPWDLLDLGMLPESSAALPAIRQDWRPVHNGIDPQPSVNIDLTGGCEGWLNRLSKKKRHELRRLLRRLREVAPGLRIERASAVTSQRLETVRRFHRRRQADLRVHGRARRSLFDDPAESAAVERILDWGARSGRACHTWMLDGDRVLAFFLAFRSGPAIYLFLTSFDHEMAPYSPAGLALWQMLEAEAGPDSGPDAPRIILMLPGLNPFKSQFGTDRVEHLQIQILHPRRPLAALRWHWLRAGRRLRRALAGPDSRP